jgi:arylformamidase
MPLYDITLSVHPDLAPWPGDTPYTFTRNARISEGASVNLGSLGMSVHIGTHTDAPYHFSETGSTAEKLDLNAYIGPAVVVDVLNTKVITPDALQNLDLQSTPRVLFKTGAWRDHTRFPLELPLLDAAMPVWLKERGVVLVGLDVPSVDALESKDLPIHHALGGQGIAILESLLLRDVPAGVYELLALPLKLVGADGAPVRAVLRTLP